MRASHSIRLATVLLLYRARAPHCYGTETKSRDKRINFSRYYSEFTMEITIRIHEWIVRTFSAIEIQKAANKSLALAHWITAPRWMKQTLFLIQMMDKITTSSGASVGCFIVWKCIYLDQTVRGGGISLNKTTKYMALLHRFCDCFRFSSLQKLTEYFNRNGGRAHSKDIGGERAIEPFKKALSKLIVQFNLKFDS